MKTKRKEIKKDGKQKGRKAKTEMGAREQKETRRKEMKRGKRERRMEKVRNTEK